MKTILTELEKLASREEHDEFYHKAKEMFENAEFDKLDKLLEEKIQNTKANIKKQNKELAKCYNLLGDVKYLKQLDLKDAHESYEKAVELDPDNPKYLKNLKSCD